VGRASRPRPKKLGPKLKRIRAVFGYSQVAMAQALAFKTVYPAHISQYERGTREPPLPVLMKYARLAGISTDTLIDDKLEYK
jgi:transcriptional regulator with XRE-family HTH domain